MLGNFSFHNPTKLYFGENALDYLDEELPKYGKTVQLIYGGGSIRKNGVYDAVVAKLIGNGKTIVEDGGVMPNPTVEKLREGVAIARQNKVDLLLAVGGGSCCDYAKATRIRGKNTISALKSRIARSFPWAACSPWRALVRK